jgi:regulator of sigma E protease
MSAIGSSLAAVLLLAVLIIIHELGHFLVAKACGVRVHVFSVGMGARAFGVNWRGTDYRVSWFPFGGYVRMAGADPFMEGGAEDEDDPRAPGAFMSKPAWQRLLIVAAGPLMNLALPFVVFTALLMAGEPQPRAVVGSVQAGSVAESIDVRPDDRVVSVDGVSVATWIDVIDAFEGTSGAAVPLRIERDGAALTVSVPFAGVDVGERRDPWDVGLSSMAMDATVVVDDPSSPVARAGLKTGDIVVEAHGQAVRDWNDLRRAALDAGDTLALRWRRGDDADAVTLDGTAQRALWGAAAGGTPPESADADEYVRWGLAAASTSVASFSDTSAAKAAGVAIGDRLLAIDGTPIRAWGDVVRLVGAAASGEGEALVARPMTLRVRREGRILDVSVTPQTVRDTDDFGRYRWRPLLGIGGGARAAEPDLVPRPYPLPEAFRRASEETFLVAGFIVEQIGKLFTNEAAIRESLGGPVEMFRQTKAAAERGLFDWARTLGLFSISLGIINLLPVPVLDGGQLVIYGAEWLRGRPLPLVLRERAQQVGVIFLVLLMLFVLVNDLHRAVVG